MGPLTQPPQGDLKKALTTLEPGESWALQPQNIDDNPYLWTPGIKWGVQPQSDTHLIEFFGPLDYFHLRGQDNILRYLPVGNVVIRLHEDDSLFETLARIAAAILSGCSLRISSPKDLATPVTRFLNATEGRQLIGGKPVIYELDKELIKSIPLINRIRYAAPQRVPQDVRRAAAETGFYIACTPVMMDGRIELLQYYRQQSICNNYHRYGNLGERAPEFEAKSTAAVRVKNPGPASGL